MSRIALFILLFLSFAAPLAPPAFAQMSKDVAEGRQAYIDGDFDRAMAILRPAAEAGDSVAQNILGAAYQDGNGVAQDIAVSLEWFEKAAAQNYDRAIYNLGLAYTEGLPGLPIDYKKAAIYYDRAIALGYHFAMNNRGRMHEFGRGGDVNLDAAIDLYQRAAEQNNTLAMNNLGNIYVRDKDGRRNYGRALNLFHRSALLGDLTGLNNLGAMYENGYGVGQDRLAALAIYKMAADKGLPRAASNLAFELVDERNPYADPVEGFAWCLFALDNSDDIDRAGYEEDCRVLRGRLDANTVEAAEALYASW